MTGEDRADEATEESYWERKSSPILGGSAVGILAIGTIVYHFIEDWSWVDSFYFSSVALTTVGFGDFAPTSDASKLFTVVYIFSGIAVISLFVNERLKKHARHGERRRRS